MLDPAFAYQQSGGADLAPPAASLFRDRYMTLWAANVEWRLARREQREVDVGKVQRLLARAFAGHPAAVRDAIAARVLSDARLNHKDLCRLSQP